jgi:rhodanese-related sulfurtransferase
LIEIPKGKGGDSTEMTFETMRTNDIIKYIGKSNILIIDLREREEYEAGHIPSAINIPYEELEEMKGSLNRNYLLIFYCDRGNISLLAARDLLKDGYNIKSMYGGIHAYNGRLERG